MLDNAQRNFLLESSNVQKISQFLSENGFNDIRITTPQTIEDKGKIILLVAEAKGHDDYTVGRLLHELRKLSVLGKNPHRKELTIQIEDNIKPLYKKRMMENAIPFTVKNIQKLPKKDKSLDVDIKEDESNKEVLVGSLNFSIKRGRITNMKKLNKVFENAENNTREELESRDPNTNKRSLSQV